MGRRVEKNQGKTFLGQPEDDVNVVSAAIGNAGAVTLGEVLEVCDGSFQDGCCDLSPVRPH